MNEPKHHFNERNKASEILAKIGSGSADADFARATELAVERAQRTGKKCKVVLTVEVEPRDDQGCLVMRADVVAKLAKLPAPATQFHQGQNGELLTQMEFLVGGGRYEVAAKPEVIAEPKIGSGRFPVAGAAPKAPLAPPAPKAPVHDGGPTPNGRVPE